MSRKGLLLFIAAALLIGSTVLFCGSIFAIFWLLGTENSQYAGLNPDWLATTTELEQISDDIGIVQWQVTGDLPGLNRICRMFEGDSWSTTPSAAMNCANLVSTDSTFEEIIESMYGAGILYPTDIALQPKLTHNHDYALYTHMAENGHSVYDAFTVGDNVLFRATVTVGTPLGYTNQTLFDEQGEVIEAYLKNMLALNLEKSR